MPKKKYDSLTGIRAAAALWVVLSHFRSTPVVSSLGFAEFARHGGWGVDIFFVLSGIVLSLNYATILSATHIDLIVFRTYIRKRFAKVYPLHLATFAAMAAAWLYAVRTHADLRAPVHNSVWTAICNLLPVHAWGVTKDLSWNTPSWSISAEWFAYIIIFPICVRYLAH